MKKIIYLFALLLVFYSCKKQNNCSEPSCVFGCMDSTATNYDSLATIADSSCWVVSVDVNPNYSSDGIFNIEVFAEDVRTLKITVYNRLAQEVFATDPEEFTGNYTKQINLTGNATGTYILHVLINDDEFFELLHICTEPICVYGCMDSTATNYDSLATMDDGSCWTITIDIFPNPSVGVFNITIYSKDVRALSIKVLSVVGEEIISEDLGEFIGEYVMKIDLTGNNIGVYFLEMMIANEEHNKKLILQ